MSDIENKIKSLKLNVKQHQDQIKILLKEIKDLENYKNSNDNNNSNISNDNDKKTSKNENSNKFI